ncbi:IgA peptidase M64-domain-containing protein [Vararia minispora EC-137]|uniref:IgA peptidase M64-domain-containing protein n=1 Tax=Vararia minispora EC-137 TaxID=1314806 RepID=A0ACB8QTQ5_9AGAM|nr:IgA peptidase M64-domain-containing protein [Vararia minispora EC-137]
MPRHDGRIALEQIRVFSYDEEILAQHLDTLCSNRVLLSRFLGKTPGRNQLVLSPLATDYKAETPVFDVRRVAGSGQSNRVDVAFFSDGYTLHEKEKFFEDVDFLVQAISSNQTFHTVSPLMNFWAAFTPSRESGVGVNGRPKDTPFGLYRDGTELRALYYARPDVARASCDSLRSKCDYPVLVGLGGEFVTITPSLVNGPLVLRHELGHSVIGVGEEYDGGFAYFGANAAHYLNDPMPWAHWMSERLDPVRVERSVMPMQAYPWTLLKNSTPWIATFNSSGTYSRHLVRFSLSGLPSSEDLTVLLDGENIYWKAKEGLGVDRWHYDIYRDTPLSGGHHELTFKLNNWRLEGIAQLCSVEILEFGNTDEFNATPGFYGVFPTFSETNGTSYRPTNEDCLMRITNEPNFCSVCAEGLWLSLLERVGLIDDVRTRCIKDTATGRWIREVQVDLIPLSCPREPRGEYMIEWIKDGARIPAFSNATVLSLNDSEARGKYEVFVQFFTDEVRSDPQGLLKAHYELSISSTCTR